MPTRLPARPSALINTAVALSALLSGPAVAHAATIYVDGRISSKSCTTYAPASRSCSGGSSRAYRTLVSAASAAVAGDTVYLRGGSYGQLSPARSGTDALPITFVAYAGERPTFSGIEKPVLWLVRRSHIVVDGLTVDNVLGWGRLEDASHNTIRNCTFTRATGQGTGGGLKLVRSSYNKILDNTFDDGHDNITVQESDRNVIQGNRVSKGRHSLLSIRCGNYNVVRGNTFSNPQQKNLEIYDCQGVSDAPYKLNATKRNLVERNVIANTRASREDNDYNGIQLAGQQGIIRRNVFRDDRGGGVNFQYYADEALYNNRNRLYHNTFYNNRCYAIIGDSGAPRQYYDNRAQNNILYRNTPCSGGAAQTAIPNRSKVILTSNAILTTGPGFVNAATRDLHLAPGSPMIDAGGFLTTTTAAGSGTRLPVADAGYFYGGYGIPGELGDEIQLKGQTTVARVLGVDVAGKRLTLDRTLSWAAGTGVALRYNGRRPDMGAYEFAGGGGPSLALSVTKAGSGAGTVTSPPGISCGTDCSAKVPYKLTVAQEGTGKGSVTSAPGGISCGADCSQTYDSGAEVTLTATPAGGSVFRGWTGACTGTSPCRTTMNAARSVTASFGLSLNTATVTKMGGGAGTVTSSPPGIECGNDCAEPYNHGTVVTLTPVAAAGSRFAGWSGSCSGTGPCLVPMDERRHAVATFSTPGAKTIPGDFDGDGKPDLLWHNQRTGQLKTWLLDHGSMTADPSITPDGLDDTSWQVRGLVDLNGDGHSDILWQNRQTRGVQVWLMDRLSRVASVGLTTRNPGAFAWQIGGLADFNGDRNADILWHDPETGGLHVWLMDGTTAVGGGRLRTRITAGPAWQVEGLSDFNGDGESDILWHDRRSGQLQVWFLEGTKVTASAPVAGSVPDRRWRVARVADLDEDGRTDILWHDRETGDLLVWYLSGTTVTSRAPLDPSRFTEAGWTLEPSAAR